jgi:transposase
MTFESQAESMSREEIVALLKRNQALQEAHRELQQSYEELSRQVEWFKRELFGAKSERRLLDPDGRQLSLGEVFRSETSAPAAIEIAGHRRRSVRTENGKAEEEALRFDPTVPVEEIRLPNPELENGDLSEYELVGEKVTCRLAQRPGSYVVLRYVRPVYKKKTDGSFSCPPAPPSVLEKSCADVSFLAGLLIDKFIYHLPLYRQHQRLAMAGVHLSRATLTNLVHRVADLLRPVYQAQLESILGSQVLAMDETPIKAGRKAHPPPRRGQMQTAYFWPIYGDRDEIAFPFATTRGASVVREALQSYVGVLLSDGYRVYDRYAASVNGIVHAQCWSHTRRQFVKAEAAEPARVRTVLEIIAELYAREGAIRARMLSPEKVLAVRGEQMKPIVDRFFEELRRMLQEDILLPTNPFTKAASYALSREESLRVFLEYPDVPLDTNHLERAIRPIAVGRKNWLFCWTELGAEYVGIIQSLLSTCRVRGIDPYTYLVDVLQRIDAHPAKDVALLTPRLWKEHFAQSPIRSDVDRAMPQLLADSEG